MNCGFVNFVAEAILEFAGRSIRARGAQMKNGKIPRLFDCTANVSHSLVMTLPVRVRIW